MWAALLEVEDQTLAAAVEHIQDAWHQGQLTPLEASQQLGAATDPWSRNRRILRELFAGADR